MRRATAAVKLSVLGPILTQSSSAGAPGVDALMARTLFPNDEGQPVMRYYLAGTLIKGLLREAWQELGTADAQYTQLVDDWLGVESPHDSDDAPERGRVRFSDFVDEASDPTKRHTRRTRIAINEQTGAADARALQVVESPYAPGQSVDFRGRISWLTRDGEAPDDLRERLLRGLLWLRAVGGIRTAGFGRVVNASIELTETTLPEAEPAGPTRLRLRLRFSEPVMFSRRRVSDNWFESEEVIPGGALKGAVACMIGSLGEFAELRSELHKVRFRHAFPASIGEQRPEQWPLSLASFSEPGGEAKDKAVLVDMIGSSGATPRGLTPPAFDIDWKEHVARSVRRKFGWPTLGREVRVRTAIESSMGTANKGANGEGGKLFAWQMIQPYSLSWDKSEDKRPAEWISEVDTAELSEVAREQLERLLTGMGLEPLGKSKAHAAVKLDDASAADVDASEVYRMVLQTPALLVAPDRGLADNYGPGPAGAEYMRAELEAVWLELSDHSLQLIDYYQRCSLAGGGYFLRRFGAKDLAYRPYLLTDAGSVFLLKPISGREQEALECLREWRRLGLPLPASVRGFYGFAQESPDLLWRRCPYLPENGYAEVFVNLPVRYGVESHV